MNIIGMIPVMQSGGFFQNLLGGEGGSGSWTTFVMMGGIILIFWLLMIRPQRKKQKEDEAMRSAIAKGDKVTTIGGIKGIVNSVKEETIVIKVDDSAKIEFLKSAISTVDKKANEAVTE